MMVQLGLSATSPLLSDGDSTFTPGVSHRTGSTTTYEHGDIKNRVAQTSTSQSISGAKTYDAFGNVQSSTGTWSGQFGYGGNFGYQSDSDSGLMLLGHRYYDASTGRFISSDPIGDGRNWYGYCDNNLLKFADCDGLKKKLVIVRGDVSGAAGAIAAFFPAFVNEMRRLYGELYDIVVHDGVGVGDVADQIAAADAVILYGHGSAGEFVIHPGVDGQTGRRGIILNPKLVRAIGKLRKKRGRGRLDFVFIASCGTCAQEEWVAAWYELAGLVFGYDDVTYDPPFRVPQPRLFPDPRGRSQARGAL